MTAFHCPRHGSNVCVPLAHSYKMGNVNIFYLQEEDGGINGAATCPKVPQVVREGSQKKVQPVPLPINVLLPHIIGNKICTFPGGMFEVQILLSGIYTSMTCLKR